MEEAIEEDSEPAEYFRQRVGTVDRPAGGVARPGAGLEVGHLRRPVPTPGDVVEAEVVQVERPDGLLGALGRGRVLRTGNQLGADGGGENIAQDRGRLVADLLPSGGPPDEVADEGLRY